MTYTMNAISSGTRLRKAHDVFAAVVASFASGALLQGDEVWIAPADGQEVKAGDKWLHVTHVDGKKLAEAGWTAVIHKGIPVCQNFKEDTGTPAPATVYKYPESFVLTAPDGTKVEYQFVRVLP